MSDDDDFDDVDDKHRYGGSFKHNHDIHNTCTYEHVFNTNISRIGQKENRQIHETRHVAFVKFIDKQCGLLSDAVYSIYFLHYFIMFCEI